MLEIQQRWGIFLYLRNIVKMKYNIVLISMWNRMINRDHVIKIGSKIEIMIETLPNIKILNIQCIHVYPRYRQFEHVMER